MNILRYKRKGKLKNVNKRIWLVFLSLVMTIFAWFTYTRVLNTNLDLHINAWNIKYYLDGTEIITNPFTISVPKMYPAMENDVKNIVIQNNGEVYAEVKYELSEMKILGDEYELVSNASLATTDKYIVLGEETESDGVVRREFITNSDQIPFSISIENTKVVSPDSNGSIKITVGWNGDSNELDSAWGYKVATYMKTHTDELISFKVKINVNQILNEEE